MIGLRITSLQFGHVNAIPVSFPSTSRGNFVHGARRSIPISTNGVVRLLGCRRVRVVPLSKRSADRPNNASRVMCLAWEKARYPTYASYRATMLTASKRLINRIDRRGSHCPRGWLGDQERKLPRATMPVSCWGECWGGLSPTKKS